MKTIEEEVDRAIRTAIWDRPQDVPIEVARARKAIAAYKQALKDRGWKIVPMEPTREMVEAGDKCERPSRWESYGNKPTDEVWFAMLAVAPEEPK